MSNKKIFIFILITAFCTVPAFSKWSEPVPVTVANDPSAEDWSPFITTDGLTLYFARVRSSNSYYGKICAATRNDIDEPFTSAQVLDCPLNKSPGHQLCPWVSCDNLRMYYHNEDGRYRIMLSERNTIDEPWPAGKSIEELNRLGDKLQAPALSEDELIIVFNAYNIPGGKGDYDLWLATRTDRHSSFTKYRNLSEINSESGEFAPFLSPDGLELYFSSNRNGHSQLFKATRNSLDELFVNLKPLSQFNNLGMDVAHPRISYNGKELYFRLEKVSDRSTRDIYVTYLLKDNSFLINKPDPKHLYDTIENVNKD